MKSALVPLVAIALASPFGAQAAGTEAVDRGILTFGHENDILTTSDDEYTSGLALSWVSPPIETMSEGNFVRRFVEVFDFLPTFGGVGFEQRASFSLGQEIYTPEDISAPVPPLDEQPYAGILFLDTSIHSRGPSSLHSYKLRLGLVGPSSGAESVQRTIHRWTGSTIPEGWDSQLEDEFLVNLDYRYDRRLRDVRDAEAWGYDFTADAGAGAGNYYVGANVGIQARGGYRLPPTYGSVALRSGGTGLIGYPAGSDGWRAWAFVEGRAFGVARFLPTDGNTFVDGPSTDRESFPVTLTTGLVLGWRRVLVHYSFTGFGGLEAFARRSESDYGTLAISYRF